MKKEIKIILALLILILAFGAYAYSFGNEIDKYPSDLNISSNDRVLIVAPHPDDESISSSGVIRYCVENNIPVHVLIITNGGKFSMGIKRHSETLNATAKLGLPANTISFLDYPQVVNDLFNINWDEKDIYMDGTSHNPFAFKDNAPYTGASLEQNTEYVIQNFKPTIIIYPYFNDANPDHLGTNAFVDYATNRLGYNAKKYMYLVHVNSLWPFPRSYFPQTSLLPPDSVSNQSKWVSFPLNDSYENMKLNAVNSYKSQMTHDPTYLRSFVRKNEIFSINQQINIVKQNNTKDYVHGSNFSSWIYNDPLGDNINPDDVYAKIFSQNKKFDITKIGFEIDNRTTWFSIETNGDISQTGFYQFHVRSFDSGKVQRLDFIFKNNTLSMETPSCNSIHTPIPTTFKVENNTIIIGFPSDALAGNIYMISVDDTDGKNSDDSTGWLTLNII